MLYLRTLGSLSIERSGMADSDIGLQRSRLALLAVVAAAVDRGVRRDQLVTLFWPEADAPHARGALKQAVYVLRRALGEPDLFLGVDTLRLNPARIASDVGEFEAAFQRADWERAATLYRGPFLPALHLGNGEFDRWRDGVAEQLALRHRRALEAAARAAGEAGRLGEAVDHWRTLAAADRSGASTTIELMQALVRAGDPAEALRQVALHREWLRAELEVEPDPAVVKLAEEIRARFIRHPTERAVVQGEWIPTAVRISEAVADTRLTASERPRIDEDSAGPAVPSPRFGAIRIAVMAAVMIAGLTAAPLRTDSKLVALSLEPLGDVPLGPRVGATMATQLRLRDPARRFGFHWGRSPRYRAAVVARLVADSVELTARVSDRRASPLPAVEPVVVDREHVGDGVRELADELAIAMAAGESRVFASWGALAALPKNWEGFRSLEAALQNWQPPEPLDSTFRFTRSAELDPTSGTPLVLAALALTKLNLRVASDSLLDALRASARRLGPWDRAQVQVLRAWNRPDFAEGHLAAHRLLDLLPESEWALIAAHAALDVGRDREALELLDRVPKDLAWPKRWVEVARSQALTLVGDFEVALAEANQRLRLEPDNTFYRQSAIKALAGLGRVSEVRDICVRALAVRFDYQPCGQAMIELRGRGYRDAAAAVAQRYVEAVRAVDSASAATVATERIAAAYAIGDWAGLRRAVGDAPVGVVARDNDLRAMAAAGAAARGDRVAAQALLPRQDAGDYVLLLYRAEVAALLGERDRAVALIASAHRAGWSRRFTLFEFPGLDGLKGYPPFDTLTKPIEDPAHRIRYAVH